MATVPLLRTPVASAITLVGIAAYLQMRGARQQLRQLGGIVVGARWLRWANVAIIAGIAAALVAVIKASTE